MRFGNFEGMNQKPLGEGDEKKVFINPEDEGRVIAVTKKEAGKDTPRQLKGRYYLTKIAHMLLPQHVPDIYQAGESQSGVQTVDAERIAHTQGHALLQEARQLGEGEESAHQQIIKEMDGAMTKVDMELERIGLSFNIDANVGNYTKDEAGNVYYLETFKPWQVDVANPKELEVLFDEEEMRIAIDGMADQEAKAECMNHLERLLALLEEERQELREQPEAISIECGPHVQELEATLEPFLKEDVLAVLHTIQTEDDAIKSKERADAKKVLLVAFNKLKFLQNETNITTEEYARLQAKYKTLDRAIGVGNRGVIDHTR